MNVLIVGAGAFGVSTSIELTQRGYTVTLLDRSPIVPHPYASSEDTSKLVRLSYGNDLFYSALMLATYPLWDLINEEFGELYHKTGILYLTESQGVLGDFEYDSSVQLGRIGMAPERLDKDMIERRFPQWNTEVMPYGWFNEHEGWVESGRVVEAMFRKAIGMGVEYISDGVKELVIDNGTVVGVLADSGEVYYAELFFIFNVSKVIIAAGAWSSSIMPELREFLTPTGQVVFHYQVNPEEFSPEEFPPFSADITKTGYYGFTTHPTLNTIKVGHHGAGYPLALESADSSDIDEMLESVLEAETQKFKSFLEKAAPNLSTSRVQKARMCLYCDSFDHNWIIDHYPYYKNVIIASGGSGTAFKFTPILGQLVADALENKPNRFSSRFKWREEPVKNQDEIRLRPPKL